MQNHKWFISLAGLVTALAILVGCSDDPSNQAIQNIQQKTAEAMEVLVNKRDTEQARTRLAAARSIRATGLARDSAFLASGNLELNQSRRQAADLNLLKPPARKELIAIHEQLDRILKLQLQHSQTQRLISSSDQEILELRQNLETGTEVMPSLHQQLAEAGTRLRQLEAQQAQWQQKQAEADRQLAALQNQADAKMNEAKSASGALRADLEQESYKILLRKKTFYFDKQEAVNQLTLLDDQIALLSPVAQRLETDILQTQEKIRRLEQSEELARLRDQQRQLTGQIDRETGVLRDHLTRFRQTADHYRQAADQVLASLDEVLAQYQTVQARDIQPTVLYKKAQTQSLAASVTADRLLFESSLSLAVEGLLPIVENEQSLLALLQEGFLTVAEDQLLAKAVETFDQADQTFEQALTAGQTLGADAARQFTLNVTKSRLLNLHTKMKLADALDRYELAEQTQEAFNQQRTEAVELGPAFTQSETARLLEKGLNYIPRMPFDSELFFESIRPQISAWRQVQGTPEQKEAVARQTLAAIEQLEAEADEKLLALLRPEKQAIQAAIERGFEELISPAGGPASTDPNNR